MDINKILRGKGVSSKVLGRCLGKDVGSRDKAYLTKEETDSLFVPGGTKIGLCKKCGKALVSGNICSNCDPRKYSQL